MIENGQCNLTPLDAEHAFYQLLGTNFSLHLVETEMYF